MSPSITRTARFAVCILLIGLFACVRPLRARSQDEEHRVTVEASQPFRVALETLFRVRADRASFQLDPALKTPNFDVMQPVQLSVHDLPFDTALSLLLNQTIPRLTFKVENGVYVIRQVPFRNFPPRAEERPKTPAPKINLLLKHATLGNALDALFQKARLSYLYLPPAKITGDITLTLKNVPFDAALTRIVHSVSSPLLIHEVDDVVLITPDVPSSVLDSITKDARITVHLEDVTLYSALKSLFALSRSQYSLDPELRGYKVTFAFRNLSLDNALDTLLHQTKGKFTYRVENEVYTIVHAPQ